MPNRKVLKATATAVVLGLYGFFCVTIALIAFRATVWAWS